MREVAAETVQRSFGRHQREALSEGGLVITRHGKPALVLLPYDEFERMKALLAHYRLRERQNKPASAA